MSSSIFSNVTLVGHSTGGGEIVRYIGRHGSERVAKLVLVSAVPPLMVLSNDNPGGLPIGVFDAIRAGEAADRSRLYRDLADGPFFGHNCNNDKLSKRHVHYTFGNDLTRAESDREWENSAVNSVNRVFFEGVLSLPKPKTGVTKVDFTKSDRAPHLLISGGIDHVAPPAIQKAALKRYAKGTSTVERIEFPGRSHRIVVRIWIGCGLIGPIRLRRPPRRKRSRGFHPERMTR